MPTAHLICGSTGAGKTTYALALARRSGAIRFTVDEWMATLYWPDAPPEGVYAWAVERVERIERQTLATAGLLFAQGLDVILDHGFFTRAQRERVTQAVRGLGAAAQLHYLPVPAGERWERVAARNAQRGGTYALTVSREMFDFCEGLFEVPTAAELAGAVTAG